MRDNYDNYIVFLLGADNFDVCKKIRSMCEEFGMDEMYDACVYIAQMFQKYDDANWDKPQYDNFAHFLNQYNKEIDIFLIENIKFNVGE